MRELLVAQVRIMAWRNCFASTLEKLAYKMGIPVCEVVCREDHRAPRNSVLVHVDTDQREHPGRYVVNHHPADWEAVNTLMSEGSRLKAIEPLGA